jgi:ribonuclease P protein component
MNKYYKITEKSDFDFLYKNKHSTQSKYFGIIYNKTENADGHFHYMFSISRKFGDAVKRNEIKRRIRAIFTINLNRFESNYLFLLTIKVTSSELAYEQIESELTRLFIKIGVWKK